MSNLNDNDEKGSKVLEKALSKVFQALNKIQNNSKTIDLLLKFSQHTNDLV